MRSPAVVRIRRGLAQRPPPVAYSAPADCRRPSRSQSGRSEGRGPFARLGSRDGRVRFDATLRIWKRSTGRRAAASMPDLQNRSRPTPRGRPSPSQKASPARSSAISSPSRSRRRISSRQWPALSARSSRLPVRPSRARPIWPDEFTKPSRPNRSPTCTTFIPRRAWRRHASLGFDLFLSRRYTAPQSPVMRSAAPTSCRSGSSEGRTGRRAGSGSWTQTGASSRCRRSTS